MPLGSVSAGNAHGFEQAQQLHLVAIQQWRHLCISMACCSSVVIENAGGVFWRVCDLEAPLSVKKPMPNYALAAHPKTMFTLHTRTSSKISALVQLRCAICGSARSTWTKGESLKVSSSSGLSMTVSFQIDFLLAHVPWQKEGNCQ